jgi:hypothetical protein
MKKFETEFDGYSFPQEIKAVPQWVVSYADKIPMYSPGYQKPLEKASPTDPKTWMSFATAEHLCELNEGLLPGFVLTPDDPFTVIDMDVHADTPVEHMNWFWSIAQGSNSYVESSASGKGLHVWIYGNHGEGRRSSDYGIERYSQERFIICTGNVVINRPLSNGNGVCEYLAPMLDEKAKVIIKVEDGPQVRTDEEVVNDILTWENADFFQVLFYSPIDRLIPNQYPSGSEADAALINFLIKASPNNAQVMRIFRKTPLANRGPKPGQKDKIMADDKYLLRTINNMRSYLQVEQQRKEAEREALIAMSRNNVSAWMQNSEQAEAQKVQVKQALAVRDAEFEVEKVEYGFPPGPIGEIAKWIFQTSTMPVPVIAITTALAFASALTAKGWRYRDKHLNAYYIIAARSGTGKNTMHQGIGRIVKKMIELGDDLDHIFTAADMRSTIAWRKKLLEQVNLCTIMPEIGGLLEDLNNAANPAAAEKKNFLLNAYSAAHEGALTGGAEYSNKENNIEAKNTEVTLTVIGETTLDTLFKNLTGKLAADGFMSRFNYGVYEGYTTKRNLDTQLEFPNELVQLIHYIYSTQASYKSNGYAHNIPEDEAARAKLGEIQDFLESKLGNEAKINDETLRQIYNRIQEKTERMAGTFAVFERPDDPVVRLHHVEWSYSYIMSSVRMMLDRYKTGEIGEVNESKIRRTVANAILRYLTADLSDSKTEMRYMPHQKLSIFLRGPILARCSTQLARVEQARRNSGPADVLRRTLTDFVQEGLIELLTDGQKAALADPKDDKVTPIKISKDAHAWRVPDMEMLERIVNQ